MAAIVYAAARRSFVVALESAAELWEISVDPDAPPIFEGLVHDYRLGEAVPTPGYLNPRRTQLRTPLRELALDTSGAFVIGLAAGAQTLVLVPLDIRREIGRFDLHAPPELGALRSLTLQGRRVVEVPLAGGAGAVIIDLLGARLR